MDVQVYPHKYRKVLVYLLHSLEPQVVLLDNGEAGSGDVPTRLEKIYDEIQSFCKGSKIPLHMTGLTRNLLSFSQDADYPCGTFG